MNQTERRIYLIEKLLSEQKKYAHMKIPSDEKEQKRLLRSLVNVRTPDPIDEEFLKVQDEYLQTEAEAKGTTELDKLSPVCRGIYLWQGDITTLRCDAIVNAANSQLLGCFYPCHGCIDNQIHTYAGVQMRIACAELMKKQGHDEKTGGAKITSAYNLPCKYVIHTVGPIVCGEVMRKDEDLLASCYRSCLELAEKHGIQSIAFCCISTGEFHFPNQRAAEVAVTTVKTYLSQTNSKMEVIFNVFKDIDHEIYRQLLG